MTLKKIISKMTYPLMMTMTRMESLVTITKTLKRHKPRAILFHLQLIKNKPSKRMISMSMLLVWTTQTTSTNPINMVDLFFQVIVHSKSNKSKMKMMLMKMNLKMMKIWV